MKRKTKTTALCMLSALFVVSTGASGLVAFADDTETTYYVCYSTDNYQPHAMTAGSDGEYIYSNVYLNSSNDFYVTDGTTKWYGIDDYARNLHVEKTANYHYNILFHPTTTYEKTKSHISYEYYSLEDIQVTATDSQSAETTLTLTYNPFQTGHDEYYKDGVYLTAGTTVSYTEGSGVAATTYSEEITESGNYRILYTPKHEVGFVQYGYDEDGNYGSGSSYTHHLYCGLLPQYYVALEGATESDYISLSRNEESTSTAQYQTDVQFIGDSFYDSVDERYEVYYKLYRKDIVGATTVYTLIDDGNDPDDDNKKDDGDLAILTTNDKGNYRFSVTDSGSGATTTLSRENSYLGGYYAAGTMNNYLFSEADGSTNLGDNAAYRFSLIPETDEAYNEDYAQYTLKLTVTSEQLESGDTKLYITDGQNRYRNTAGDIVLNTAGEYTFTFSDEHRYDNGRNYTYTLVREPQTYTTVEISSEADWNALAKKCRDAEYSMDKEVHLKADLNFNNKTFVAIPLFTGIFDGEGHTITGVVLTNSNRAVSLIEKITDSATVQNFTVDNVTLGGKDCEYVGVVGRNYGLVTGVTVKGTIQGQRYVGGIVAYNGTTATDDNSSSTNSDAVRKGRVENCVNEATLFGVGDVGGICGFSAGDISDCTNKGVVKGGTFRSDDNPLDIGGITGYLSGRVSACTNTAQVGAETTGFYVGGVAGLCTGGIYFSVNSGDVFGRRYAGGIVGYYGTLQQDDDWNNYFGGTTLDAIMNTYAQEEDTGNDSTDQSTGTESVIAYCRNTGKVQAVRYAGGALGNSTVDTLQVFYVYNGGNVAASGGNYAGGIAGYGTGTFKGCYSLALVSASDSYAGGIVGYGGTIQNCAASGVVQADDFVGGLAGYISSGTVYSNYANAAIVYGKNARQTGNIAGGATAVEGSLVGLSDSFYANYYVGDNALHYGIAQLSYGKNYKYAASATTCENLIAMTNLSSDFSTDDWSVLDGAFPIPKGLTEGNADEDVKDLYDNDEKYAGYFDSALPEFTAALKEAAKPYAVTVFLEWNEDDGDLFDEDDGSVNTENFVVIGWVRTAYGESVTAPETKYATVKNGRLIFEGEEANYFVTLQGVASVDGNSANYCSYEEIITTLRTADGSGLVEGAFTLDTTCELTEKDGEKTLVLKRGDSETTWESVTIKVKTEHAKWAKVYINGEKAESKVVGDYLAFTLHYGDTFHIEANLLASLAWWAWLLIGLAIAAVVAGIVVLAVFLIKKRKKKAAAKAVNASEENTVGDSTVGDDTVVAETLENTDQSPKDTNTQEASAVDSGKDETET